jgi:hypothetical protein
MAQAAPTGTMRAMVFEEVGRPLRAGDLGAGRFVGAGVLGM